MTIQTTPLNTLKLSKTNPRQQIDPAGIEGLAASIATDGLLQSLLVQPKGKKSYEVIAGERRYRALQLLLEKGEIASDYPVAVTIKSQMSQDQRHRVATMENVQREALSPIDEAEAFAKLAQDGVKLEDIAAKTGVSVATIRRRLAIAHLCEEAKAALRTGAITLSMAEALTLGAPEMQQNIIHHIANDRYGHWTADRIRNRLTTDRAAVSIALFPIEQYSGALISDLFGEDDETYFEDMEQFQQLQTQAIKSLSEDYATRFEWVEIIHDTIFQRWLYQPAPEGESGGVIIHVHPDLQVEVHEGLMLRHDDSPAKEDTPQEKPEYSKPTRRYMACQKSMAVQATLLSHPRKLKELMAAMMLSRTGNLQLTVYAPLREAAKSDSPAKAYELIENEAQQLKALVNLDEDDMPYGYYQSDDTSAWHLLAERRKEPVACYQAIGQLDDETLERLVSLLFVLSVGQRDIENRDKADALFDAVAVDLGVSMRDWWQPDRDFLSMRTRDQIIDIASDCGAHLSHALANASKKKLVDCVAKHFEKAAIGEEPDNDENLPESLQKARAWCPPAMRFEKQESVPEESAEPLAA